MTTIANAAAFLQREYGVSGMKLQKILYYAQAAALAQRGEALFPEEFQAWRHGPVNREVWEGNVAPAPLPTEDAALLQAVWEKYGHLTALQLSDLSHADAPWKDVRGNLPEAANCERVIPQREMQAFYLGRQLVQRENGTWEHVIPAEQDRMHAKLNLILTQRQRRGRLTGQAQREFIQAQVVATQRLEGIAVEFPPLHG